MPRRTQVARRGADGQTYGDGESGADRRSDSSESGRPASVQSSLLLTPDAARFPLEIIEDFIDRMDNDTLIAAAQVCAAWYPRAMRNLYYAIEIRRRGRFDMLFKQCHASQHVKQWLATTRELRVTDDDSMDDTGGRNPRFLHAVPPALGHTMSGVQCFAISGLRSDVHETFFLALSQFSSVESLALTWCSLNLSQLRRIIYTFPLLTTLTLEDIQIAPHDTITGPVGATSFRSPSDIHLRHLRIIAHRKPKFIDWIAQSGLCISLEDLTVCVDKSSRQSLSALLQTAGSSLTRLRSHYVHGDLVQNTALRSLDLHLNKVRLTVQSKGRNTNKLVNELHGVLSTVRSCQLEHLEIAISVHGGFLPVLKHLASALERIDLRALHEAISQPRFNALKDVNVKVDMWGLRPGGETKAEVEDFSRKFEAMFWVVLRPWSDRGIIKCIAQVEIL